MSTPDPLLVVVHEATRTGSVRVVIDLLAATSAGRSMPLAIRAETGGPLLEELTALADVEHETTRPAAVFVNSALAAGVLHEFDASVPATVYVHEIDAALRALPLDAVEALRRPDVEVLCVSATSHDDLVALGVHTDRITILPPLVPTADPVDPETVAGCRRGLGVPEGGHLVVGCGEASWRKGTDLFLDVVRRLDGDGLVAAWVGRRPPGFARMLDHDLARIRPRCRVEWIGEVADPRPFLAAAEALVLTSREDPQPLVPLEAALAGTPTAAFALGGGRELGEDGAALVAPYPDTVGLASAVHRLLSEPSTAAATADAARRRAAQHGPDVVLPAFLDALARLSARVPAQADSR